MKSIGLHNVKAFVDTGSIDLAPITIFVGQNSCGKSSFIRFPQVLSQTLTNNYTQPILLYSENQPDVIDFGFFQDVVHKGANNFGVSLEFKMDVFSMSDNTQINYPDTNQYRTNFQGNDIVKLFIQYTCPSKNAKIYATNIQLFINDSLFSEFTKEGETRKYYFHQYKSIQDKKLIDVDYAYSVKASTIRNFMPEFNGLDEWTGICEQAGIVEQDRQMRLYEKLVMPLRKSSMIRALLDDESDSDLIDNSPSIDSGEFNDLLNRYNAFQISGKLFFMVFDSMRREFYNLHYIGPFRSNPRRAYRKDETSHNDVGVYGDYTSSLLINDFQNDGKLISLISDWFKNALNIQVKVSEIGEGSGYYQIKIADNSGQTSNLMDVGYGISQVLPIVTQMSKVTNESLERTEKIKKSKNNTPIAYPEMYIVEQPELHLHPNAQAELASLFAMSVQRKIDKNKKILIETHSEHIIRKIQLLIADINNPLHLSKDQVKIYYVHGCQQPDANHGSWIEEMEMDEYGQFLKEWPSGFFDKAYNLTSEHLTAINKRKRAEKVNQS